MGCEQNTSNCCKFKQIKIKYVTPTETNSSQQRHLTSFIRQVETLLAALQCLRYHHVLTVSSTQRRPEVTCPAPDRPAADRLSLRHCSPCSPHHRQQLRAASVSHDVASHAGKSTTCHSLGDDICGACPSPSTSAESPAALTDRHSCRRHMTAAGESAASPPCNRQHFPFHMTRLAATNRRTQVCMTQLSIAACRRGGTGRGTRACYYFSTWQKSVATRCYIADPVKKQCPLRSIDCMNSETVLSDTLNIHIYHLDVFR